jgi:hypothetical protein
VSPSKRTNHRERILAAVTDLLADASLTELERLRLMQEVHGHMSHAYMPRAVEQALDHGETWAAVADALGLRSRQAAQQQWSRRLTARRLTG